MSILSSFIILLTTLILQPVLNNPLSDSMLMGEARPNAISEFKLLADRGSSCFINHWCIELFQTRNNILIHGTDGDQEWQDTIILTTMVMIKMNKVFSVFIGQ